MTNNYRFASDTEPSEKDMEELMHEVALEAKKKAELAEKKLREELKVQITEAQNREKLAQQ